MILKVITTAKDQLWGNTNQYKLDLISGVTIYDFQSSCLQNVLPGIYNAFVRYEYMHSSCY
jgi:hypothetical protein